MKKTSLWILNTNTLKVISGLYEDMTDHRSYIHNLSSSEIYLISQLHNSLHNF